MHSLRHAWPLFVRTPGRMQRCFRGDRFTGKWSVFDKSQIYFSAQREVLLRLFASRTQLPRLFTEFVSFQSMLVAPPLQPRKTEVHSAHLPLVLPFEGQPFKWLLGSSHLGR